MGFGHRRLSFGNMWTLRSSYILYSYSKQIYRLFICWTLIHFHSLHSTSLSLACPRARTLVLGVRLRFYCLWSKRSWSSSYSASSLHSTVCAQSAVCVTHKDPLCDIGKSILLCVKFVSYCFVFIVGCEFFPFLRHFYMGVYLLLLLSSTLNSFEWCFFFVVFVLLFFQLSGCFTLFIALLNAEDLCLVQAMCSNWECFTQFYFDTNLWCPHVCERKYPISNVLRSVSIIQYISFFFSSFSLSFFVSGTVDSPVCRWITYKHTGHTGQRAKHINI